MVLEINGGWKRVVLYGFGYKNIYYFDGGMTIGRGNLCFIWWKKKKIMSVMGGGVLWEGVLV